MNVALQPGWTRERFLHWVEGQDEPYEFDGERPVLMTRGNNNHRRIIQNILMALERRRGGTWDALGPDAGLATAGGGLRYPDALVSVTPIDGLARLVADPVIVFEVPSPSSQRNDRIVKVLEYAEVPTIRRYVIVELGMQALSVLSHDAAGTPWTSALLAEGDTLVLPEIGVELPLSEIYDRVGFGVREED